MGKLLLDERDEKVDADKETFNKLYSMIGGGLTLFILGISVIIFKYFEIFKQGVTQTWSDAPPEQ